MGIKSWYKNVYCIILVSGVDNRGGYVFVGAGGIWEISVPSQFYYKPKTVLKKLRCFFFLNVLHVSGNIINKKSNNIF